MSAHNSCTFTLKGESSPASREGRVIHDSLSKFKARPQPPEEGYSETLRRNDEIAASLINSKMVLGSKQKGRSEATKDLLFHLNKNRSLNGKKVELRRIDFDRYQSIQEPPQLNLKFPTIDRNAATIEAASDKMPFLDELRSRMKLIEKRQRTDHDDEVVVIAREEDKEREGPEAGEGGARVREELYGLLPSFRSPNLISEQKKKHKLHKNFKLKIEMAQDASIREVVSEYLEKNIVTRSIPIAQKKTKDMREKVIFNKEILDATVLENKEELELIDSAKQE
jgi:hypothetical protein